MINLCPKVANVSNLFCEKGAAKKTQISHIFKGRCFVMGGPIDMNLGVF